MLEVCLTSLKRTPHRLEKVYLVEDSYPEQEQCRHIAEKYGVIYKKSNLPRWQENTYALPWFWDCNVVIISHSDVEFIGNWFEYLEESWDEADPNIVALNMSVDAVRYKTGHPVYSWRQMPGDRRYGVAIDMHVQNKQQTEARMRLGRLSPVSSFRVDFLHEHHPFDVDFDCELFLKMTLAKKWSMWLNNQPLLHVMGENGGFDTDMMIAQQMPDEVYFAPLYRIQSEFKAKYGIELYDYLYHDFGMNRWNALPDIIECANTKNLAKLDPLLEAIGQDILNKTVPSYERLYA